MNIYFQGCNQRAFGTWPLKGNEARDAVLNAAEVGYRAFDTAQLYGNEADVGLALAETGIKREDLCITTKVTIANYSDSLFIPSVEQSLRKLCVDSVDVLLLHWPPANGEIAKPLTFLQQAHDQGMARNIGVSNFTSRMMRDIKKYVNSNLVTNQVEFHPLLNQDILLATAIECGIPLSSYCSTARGAALKYPLLSNIGIAYNKTAVQVALRWTLQKGVNINSMSTNKTNLRNNFDVMDFTLSCVDMSRIDALTSTGLRNVTKELVPHAPDFD